MVGLEGIVVPLIGEGIFGLDSKSAVLSFLVSFGVVKAVANRSPDTYRTGWGGSMF